MAGNNKPVSKQKATNVSILNVGARRPTDTSGTVGPLGTDITNIRKGTFTLDPASIASGAQAEQTVTITGVTTSDVVIVNPPAALEALIVGQARVTAADTVKFMLANNSGGAVDGASRTWTYVAIRF